MYKRQLRNPSISAKETQEEETNLQQWILNSNGLAGTNNFFTMCCMVCVLLVKLRRISTARIDLLKGNSSPTATLLQPVLPKISEFLLGDRSFQQRQRNDINRLLFHHPSVRMAAQKLRDGVLISTNLVPSADPSLRFLPVEFLHLLQDCFFLSPGVSDLLMELLPE